MLDANGADPEAASAAASSYVAMSSPIRDVRKARFNLWVDAEFQTGPLAVSGHLTHD